ncbi:serine/arginine-rich splicing factor 3-like [Patiria miniata]|uniref:RRM domain-containing protein n=1 Tax=Patiria miniata TaxID=46514 RepID=A0A913ZRU4_PATMI|nr:serine/arginine-rich splicing factor 3-like [Patiria miniata]
MSHWRDHGPLPCKVYVGNLGSGAAKHELERAFEYYGPLINVWVARNPPGFAYVEFQDPRDAEDAVRGLDGRKVCGRRVRVELAKGRQSDRRSRRDGPPPPTIRSRYSGGGRYGSPSRRDRYSRSRSRSLEKKHRRSSRRSRSRSRDRRYRSRSHERRSRSHERRSRSHERRSRSSSRGRRSRSSSRDRKERSRSRSKSRSKSRSRSHSSSHGRSKSRSPDRRKDEDRSDHAREQVADRQDQRNGDENRDCCSAEKEVDASEDVPVE